MLKTFNSNISLNQDICIPLQYKMKTLAFTTEEKTLLRPLLKERIEILSIEPKIGSKAEIKKWENYYLVPLVSALNMLSNNEPIVFSAKERLMCISCINEHIDDYYRELDLKNAYSWAVISAEQLKVVNRLDTCNDILTKCGYFNRKEELIRYNHKFRYRDIIQTIDKLRKSETIYLAGVDTNDIYKIAFVNENKELMEFELKNDILLYSRPFRKVTEDYSKYYEVTTNRKEAKELLDSCNRSYYPKGVLEFVSQVLN